MIYGRFGDAVTIKRLAVLEDVKRLDGRKPDNKDRDAVENGSYVIVAYTDQPEKETLYHQAFLRADGGSREVTAAIEAVKDVKP